MNKKFVRIVALILCAVLILGMIPLLVHAEEIQPRSITQMGDRDYTFETFEDLKTLAAGNYDDWSYAQYIGSEPLVISENLEILENLTIAAHEADIVVPQGIVFKAGEVSAASLIVEGKMTCNYCSVGKELRVAGTLIVREVISLEPETVLIGDENITFSSDWGYMVRSCYITSAAQLLEVLETAGSAPEFMQYSIHIDAGLELPQSVTIPGNTRVTLNAPMTIPAGITMTLCGSIDIYAPLTVAGELNNQSNDRWALTICYGSYEKGQLILAEGGAFTANQRLNINCWDEALTDPQLAVPGLDLSDFDIEEQGEGWYLQGLGNLTRLGTPADLQWGYTYEWTRNPETGNGSYVKVPARPGISSWLVVQPEQGRVDLAYYRVEENEDVLVERTNWHFATGEDYHAPDTFIMSSPESGTYYFTVTSLGDYTEYANSETAISDTWTYVKPDAQLDTCTNLRFDDAYHVTWDGPSQEEYFYGYHTEWFFSESASREPYSLGSSWGSGNDPDDYLSDTDIRNHGAGYYYFRVRAISNDITQYCNSEWSKLTLAYHITEVPGDVSEEFETIMDNPDVPAAEKVEQLQQLDTDALRDTMRQDNYVVKQIAQLEEELGGPAGVEVSEAVADFDSTLISIVGANLNTTSDDSQDVTLVVDKPQEEHVIPSMYHNTVAVSFSMDLENVEDTENLDIPVEITLPVPAGINPSFLVILHYHANGTMEEIRPSLYLRNNQWYATFILTSFSDFIITEYKSEMPGDLDASGIVDDTDVAALLWYTLFPADYEISGNGDFNGDGIVDDADVAYLLWHTLFPEDYPLN